MTALSNTTEVADALQDLLNDLGNMDQEDRVGSHVDDLHRSDEFEDVEVRSFLSVGMMTNNQGFVLKVDDREFQITVVQSR